MEDFKALAPALEQPGPQVGDFVKNAMNHIINSDRTTALIKELEREPDELPSFELLSHYGEKKRDLERKAHELAIVLRERRGYTVNDELLTKTVWHLREAGFMDGDITAYYFENAQPVIVGGNGCYLLVAPKILSDE